MMSVSALTQALKIHCPDVFRNSASALEKADCRKQNNPK